MQYTSKLKLIILVFVFNVFIVSGFCKVLLGIDVFLDKYLYLVENKKVGLITNPTGTNKDLDSTIDLLVSKKVNLVALYGPEHGVRGNAQAGEYVSYYVDDKYNIPVYSLYGQNLTQPENAIENIDEYMTSFDTVEEGKAPIDDMLKDIDIMLIDIQDVGTRVYTYIATMAYAMKAAAKKNINFIVLDRPNPVGGTMEGPILEYPEYSSFIGLYPIPMRHGMTIGELAWLINDKFLKNRVKLTVIPMQGWQRDMWFDSTGLPWVIPSPNMPSLDTAIVYPGQVLLEGTNISEGRGTTKPFEFFGAPWIDGYVLAKKLNTLNLPGVEFRENWFTPTFSKYVNKLCGGVQLHVLDRNLYKPFETSLHILEMIESLYPGKLTFNNDYFDKLVGNSWLRQNIIDNKPVNNIVKNYSMELNRFIELSKNYMLYK